MPLTRPKFCLVLVPPTCCSLAKNRVLCLATKHHGSVLSSSGIFYEVHGAMLNGSRMAVHTIHQAPCINLSLLHCQKKAQSRIWSHHGSGLTRPLTPPPPTFWSGCYSPLTCFHPLLWLITPQAHGDGSRGSNLWLQWRPSFSVWIAVSQKFAQFCTGWCSEICLALQPSLWQIQWNNSGPCLENLHQNFIFRVFDSNCLVGAKFTIQAAF